MSETTRPFSPDAPPAPAQPVLWFDPVQPLDPSLHATLQGLGLQPRAWSGEPYAPLPADTQALVVRLLDDLQPLDDALEAAARQSPPLPVIARVSRAAPQALALAVEALQRGAAHVLPADSLEPADWATALRQSRRRGTPDRVADPRTPADRSVVFVDPLSQQLLALARRVARTEMTALVLGPTGAGKEVLARVLHEASNRQAGPFVAINCGALPESLIEDTLFGHERGAFSGALREHRGAFEQAHGGTLFLDEIGEMPLAMQVRLLRVLQDRQVQRLGAQRPVAVDVRIVVATHVDLRQAVREGRFREDLYFRISTFALTVPALARRPGDILPLVGHALARHGQRGTRYRLTEAARARLLDHTWPGNVRELDNVVQRALLLAGDDCIGLEHLLFDGEEPAAHLLGDLAAADRAAARPALAPAADPNLPSQGATVMPDHLPLDHVPPSPAQVEPFQAEPAPAGPPFTHPVDLASVMAQARQHSRQQLGAAAAARPALVDDAPAAGLADLVRRQEQQAIMAALRNSSSREAAARQLGISPRTLRYKLAQLRDSGLALAEA